MDSRPNNNKRELFIKLSGRSGLSVSACQIRESNLMIYARKITERPEIPRR